MITEWLMTVGLGIVSWLGTLFQAVPLPSWLLDPTSGLYGFLNQWTGLGAWLPMQALQNVLAFGLLVFAAFLIAKLVLFLWARIPFLGGGGG